MPRGRPKKNPDAVTFDFKPNPEKQLASTTLSNYKNALNRLAEYSALEHKPDDPARPIIRTKDDLLNNTRYVLMLLEKYVPKRLTRSTTLAAIFNSIGRQDEQHPYVTEFRKLYYTDSWKATLEERAKLNSAAQPLL